MPIKNKRFKSPLNKTVVDEYVVYDSSDPNDKYTFILAEIMPKLRLLKMFIMNLLKKSPKNNVRHMIKNICLNLKCL